MERCILKLSGGALKGKRESGIDPDKLLSIAAQIKEAQELNIKSIGIVFGGGNFFRGRDSEKIGLDRVDCDYLGMLGTIFNSVALKDALEKLGAKVKLFTSLEVPKAIETYDKDKANKAFEEGYIVIFAGGTGRPYCSTDTATLEKARDTHAKLILMAKEGTDGVYDSDPNKNKNAKKYDILSHKEILEKRLEVMDPDAAKIADEENIDILVFNIDEGHAILDAVKGNIQGTLIKKEI